MKKINDYLLEDWEIDINNNYYIDEDLQVWKSLDDFHEYYLDEYTGIKDQYEAWKEEKEEEVELEEVNGKEILKKIITEYREQRDYYRKRYEESL